MVDHIFNVTVDVCFAVVRVLYSVFVHLSVIGVYKSTHWYGFGGIIQLTFK